MDRDLVLESIEDVRTLRLQLSALADYDGVYQRTSEVVANGANVLATVESRLREAVGENPYVSWPPKRNGR